MPTVQLPRPSRVGLVVGVTILIVLFLMAGPFRTVPAGNVGVKDFFGSVSSSTLSPGIGIVLPMTSVIRMSVQTQEIKEVAEVPSQEGLILSLETSLLFQLDPAKAVEIYRTVGADYVGTIVEPQFRSAIREITASYEAKALYSAERVKIAGEIFTLFRRIAGDRGIIVQQVLLRKIGLPPVVADFQRIVAQGISPQLLEWKGIEATEKLATSSNAKVVVIGNSKNGLPLILEPK